MLCCFSHNDPDSFMKQDCLDEREVIELFNTALRVGIFPCEFSLDEPL